MKPQKTKKYYKYNVDQTIDKITHEIDHLKELCAPISPDNAIGRLSRMEAINEKSVNEAALRKLEERHLQLKKALKRIEDDEYGVCINCDEEIPLKRIEVMPEATTCVQCLENPDQD